MRRATLLLALVLGTGACAYDSYGAPPPGYDGAEWRGTRMPYEGPLRGPGLETLDPWLKGTEEGRAIVTMGFMDAAEGFVSEDVAHRANIWFRRYADHDRDMRITDPEIRTALVYAAGGYLRQPPGR